MEMDKKSSILVLVAVFVFAGCHRIHKEEVVDVLACGPELENLSVPPDYVVRAIEAAGGWNSWAATKEIRLDCVITFYQTDGTFYLTEQHHVVYPWSNSIRISAQEPQGAFAWQLSRGQFDVLNGGGRIDGLPVPIGSSRFSEMILSVITMPSWFLDGSVEFSKAPAGLKIQGQWYYPITRRRRPVPEEEPAVPVSLPAPLSEAVFYQDRDSSLVDMILFADSGKYLAVRGYDYCEVACMDSQGEKDGARIPGRIEIFESDAQGNLKQRLVKIDYHTISREK